MYMDLDVLNDDYATGVSQPLRFEEARNTPFLDGDSVDYCCSVVRLQSRLGTLYQ